MPEKQSGTNCFGLCSKLFSPVRKFPTLSLTFPAIKLKYLSFFYDYFIALYHFIFIKVEFFHMNLCFQRKKLWGNVCLYNHGDTYLFRFTFFTPTCKFPFFRRISLKTKLLPLISQTLTFFTLLSFWLSRCFKLCFRLSFQLVTWRF